MIVLGGAAVPDQHADAVPEGTTIEFRVDGVTISVNLSDGTKSMNQAAAVARAKDAIARLAKLHAPIRRPQAHPGEKLNVFDAWAYRND